MQDKPLRVVVWGTGGIGALAINAIARRPGIELVGVWAYSKQKAGCDAGELAGGKTNGIKVTNDADALIALEPDCVIYVASSPDRERAAVPEIERFLKAGINVVTTTTSRAIYPPTFEPWRDSMEEAAQAGGASFYASGIEPGFAADHLPLTLATQSSRITSVYAAEILLYDDYPTAHALMDGMGFGRPMDFVPGVARPGSIAMSWGSSIHMMADAFGLELDEIRENYQRVAAPRTVKAACGTIEEGTCGAVRITATGVVGGKEVLTVEHINRMHRDFAPEWPSGDGDCTYVVKIEGDPDIESRMSLKLKDPPSAGINMDAGAGPMLATAMRIVNAVPYVCKAPAGLHSSLTLPLTTPLEAFD